MDSKKNLRVFGLIWSFIFVIIAAYPTLDGGHIRQWSVITALSFFSISLLIPTLFKKIYFYQAWIKFGNFMGKVNSKIIIVILFYFIFLPIGIILKLFRKDLLSKRIDENAKSYFVDRKDQPKEMENQF